MGKYYYVTAATKLRFIKEYTKYSVRSLLNTGVDPEDIHVIGNDKKDCKLLKQLFPKVNHYKARIDHSVAQWTVFSGHRRYSLFKAGALHTIFPEPIKDRYMIYFDGDVLWFQNPEEFFDNYNEKTWFHHGKCLKKRSPAGRKGKNVEDIDVTNYKSLSQWCSAPQAHLMVKWGSTIVPEREVVAGLYLLHPRDHENVLRKTHEGCLENADKFAKHEGAGDQKPMNAAISALNVDWHGGSRFWCKEHEGYFKHYFGKQDMKGRFREDAKKLGLI